MILPQPVKFEEYEFYQFALIGVFRCYESVVKNNRQETHGSKRETSWHRHIEGRLAEAAIAKLFNRYSGGLGMIFGPDLGKITQVRQTDYKTGRLLVHDSDPDKHWFWLVTGSHGTYTVQGFMRGKEAKTFPIEEPQEGRPCHCVPISALIKDTKGVNWYD